MASGLDVQTDPVFWWWEEDGASRVVLLTDALLILSGPLTDAALAELEEARRAGTVEAADFGSDAHRVSVGAIERLRYVPDAHRLEIDLVGAGQFDIEPPRSNAGVALGVFDTLAKRLAPGREPVDSHVDVGGGDDDQALTIVGAMVVLGLVSLGLAVAADQAAPTGPLAGVRTTLNDVFAQVGYLPALILFALATVVQVHRMRRGAPEALDPAPATGPRLLELDLRGAPVVEMPAAPEPADPLAGLAASTDSPDGSTASTGAESPESSAPAWAPPQTTAAWGDEAAESPTRTSESTGAGADGWRPPSIEDSVEPSTGRIADGEADVWRPPASADDAWLPASSEASVEPSTGRIADDEADAFWSSDEITSSDDEADVSWSSDVVAEVDDQGDVSWSSDVVAEVDDERDVSWSSDVVAEVDDERDVSWSSDVVAEVDDERDVSWSSDVVAEVDDQGDVSWSSNESAGPESAPAQRVADDDGEMVSPGAELEHDDVEPSSVGAHAEDPESLTAIAATTGEVEAEFWSQSASDAPDEPWWERAEAADAGEPGTLPPPPASPFEEPDLQDEIVASAAEVDEEFVASAVEADDVAPVAPAVEADEEIVASAVEVDDVAPVAPAVEADEEIVASAVEADEVVVAPAVEADEVVEPESVLDETPEVAATDHPQVAWSDAPTGPSTDESPADGGHAVIPEPSIPAPDSPFAEILDREAPMPAWASAPEPTDQVVDRAAMERSVPATLLPEAADLD